MAEPKFSMTADDDLPRTLRREKEAREREAREREVAAPPAEHLVSEPQAFGYAEDGYEPDVVAVRYLQIPFFHLMFFFIKAVFAAIPAMILLVGVCYLIGEALQTYFPWMRIFDITIRLPPAS